MKTHVLPLWAPGTAYLQLRPLAISAAIVLAVLAVLAVLCLAAPARATEASPLAVPGHHPASHVEPARKGALPVVVVLHGNFDRPEWECDIWGQVAGTYGWILCPRGLPRKDTPPGYDRWTYGSRRKVRAEIHAAVSALEAKYPGRVSRAGMVLVGFSLGAIMAPNIVCEEHRMFTHMFLVEGGLDKLQKRKPKVLAKCGLRSAGFAMSAKYRRKSAARWVARFRSAGLRAEFVDMEGAGHGYSEDFVTEGRAAFLRLVTP